MQTYSIKRNYSSDQVGGFLYKTSPRRKHNWHCTIGFLINTFPLNVCFILNYHLFFRKKIFFSNVCISVNLHFIFNSCSSLFFCWEITHSLSTYAPGGMEGVIIDHKIPYILNEWPKKILWNIFCAKLWDNFGHVH